MIASLPLLLAWHTAQATVTPRTLVAEFIKVLDADDEAKLRAFITTWTAPGGPTDQRVERWGGFAKQGGPFKIVGDGKETDSEVDAFITDRENSRLVLRLLITKKPSLLITGLLVAPAFAVEGPPPEFSHWTSVGALAKQIAEASKAPGMGIALIHEGKLDLGVTGIRKVNDRAKVQDDDVWSIGSVGKSFCSSVIGALIEQGKLRWDETLGEAFPDAKMDPGYSKVTLEQIMHHRGGIPQDLNFNGARVAKIVGDATTPTAQRARYAVDILSRKPIGKPDEQFAYSNAGYALLSVIAERATGEPYEALVHKYVFQPLGLNHSYMDTDKLPDGRPSGHIPSPDGFVIYNMSGPIEALVSGAGGGMFMSLADLAKYGEAHMKGLRGQDGFLKSETIVRLHKGVPEGQEPRTYACGWSGQFIPGLQPLTGHNGSNGTMRAELAIFPDANLVVAAIANAGGESEPSPGFIAVMAVGQRFAPKKD